MPTKKKTTKRIRKDQKPLKPEAELALVKQRLKLKENQVDKLNAHLKTFRENSDTQIAFLKQELANQKVLTQLQVELNDATFKRLSESTREKLGLIEQLREAKAVLATRKSIQLTIEDGETQLLVHDDPYTIEEPRLRPQRSWQDALKDPSLRERLNKARAQATETFTNENGSDDR